MIRLDKSLHEAVDEIAHVNAERDDWQQRSDRMKDMNNDLTDKMSSLEQDFDKLKQERDKLLKDLKTSQLEAKKLAEGKLFADRYIYVYIYIYLCVCVCVCV